MPEKRFVSNFEKFSTKESKRFISEYKSTTGRLVNERQLLKQQESTLKGKLALLQELVNKALQSSYTQNTAEAHDGMAQPYVDALRLALKIHDEQPILPCTISYLALYLTIHHSDIYHQLFQDMDSVSSFIEAAIVLDPMRPVLYFMRCLALLLDQEQEEESNRFSTKILKQIESGLKLEPIDSKTSSWLWYAWRFGTILNYQAQDWESVLSWSTKTLQILKSLTESTDSSVNNRATRSFASHAHGRSFLESRDNDSTNGEAKSVTSTSTSSSEVAALNIESFFNSQHVIQNLFERPQYEEIAQNYSEMLFYRGSALQELGLVEEARQNFDMVLQYFPEFGLPYQEVALQSEQAGDFKSAIDAYSILLRLEPTNFQYLYACACTTANFLSTVEDESMVEDLGKRSIQLYTDALNALQQDSTYATEMQVTEDQVYVNRGVVYRKMNDLQKAFADYTTAIFINEHNRDALLGRAEIFISRGEMKDAVKDYETLTSQFTEEDYVQENASIFQFLAEQAYVSNAKAQAGQLYMLAYKCGNINASSMQQVYQIATSCVEDFMTWSNPDEQNPLQSTTLTALCLMKLNTYQSDDDSLSKDFKTSMENTFFVNWKAAAIEASDPKKKKKK